MTEKEKKNNEVIIEDEQKDDELLEKFETPAESKRKIGKQSPVKVMAIALAVVCVLVAGIFLVTNNAGEEEDDTVVLSSGDSSSNPLVDDDKMWQADVKKTKKGEIKKDGAGELLELEPKDIKQIEVEHKNEKFTILSETPTVKTGETDPDSGEEIEGTDATIYTLVGFEDFEMQSGVPDQIASICSSLGYTSIASADAKGKLADYGLKNPRAVVTVTFKDDTKAVYKVGDDIVQGRGTYVMFGTGREVFVCDTETVAPLLTSLTGMISLTVNDTVTDADNSEFEKITLSGTHFDKSIVIEPNPDSKNVENDCIITSPINALASNVGSSEVSGAIRGLYANGVAYLNPDSGKLKKFGLANPYVKISAVYPDTTVSLLASKPDKKGEVYLMEEGGKVVYKKSAADLPWVETDLKKLTSEYVLNPKLSGLSGMKVRVGGSDYNFKIKTTELSETDEYGEKSTSYETVTKYNGKALSEGNFETYFRNTALITKSDYNTGSKNGSAVLTVTYSYTGSRNPDTVAFYKNDDNKYTAALNGTVVGTVYASYVDTVISQTPNVAKDDQVNSVW